MIDEHTDAPPAEQQKRQATERGWRGRPTLRSIQEQVSSFEAKMDGSENDRTRLPDSEEIHLGAFVLAEVFPPSSAYALRRAIEAFPMPRDEKSDLLSWLSKGRSSSGVRGRRHLVTVRKGCPEGIDVIDVDLYFLQPSFTVLIATFALADHAGDLSGFLRSDWSSDGRVSVLGPFGWARSRLPWSRPPERLVSTPDWQPSRRKRQVFEELIREHETVGWNWLAGRFPGRFCRVDAALRPSVRVLTTKEATPFADDHGWLGPPDLRFRSDHGGRRPHVTGSCSSATGHVIARPPRQPLCAARQERLVQATMLASTHRSRWPWSSDRVTQCSSPCGQRPACSRSMRTN